MINADWIQKSGIRFADLKWRASGKEEFDIFAGAQGWVGNVKMGGSIFADPRLMWLDMEHEEPILNDAEKKYLKTVIKPWRDKVDFIFKAQYEHDLNKNTIWDLLHIMCTEGNRSWDIVFPIFDESQMFKGMRPGKHYELEELGL